MEKLKLNKQQVYDLTVDNRYKIDPARKFLSRCIDGRYENSENLPPLAIPGADAGEMAIILATANDYGFEVDREKAFRALIDVIGGMRNLQFHTDNHAEAGATLGGCGHLKQMSLDPEAYSLKPDQVEFVKEKFDQAKKQGAEEVVLTGEHLEGAVLQVKGPFSITPRSSLETKEGKKPVEVFVFHASLVDERHRALADKLIESGAVKLYQGQDGEYLYQVISETTEDHLMETAKRLAKGLPIYEVVFRNDGSFEIREMGEV